MNSLQPIGGLTINSAIRATGTTSSFSLLMPASPLTVATDPNKENVVALRSATIPMSFQVVTNDNNRIFFTETEISTGDFFSLSAVIGNGSYDLNAMETAVQQAMDTVSASAGFGLHYTVTIDPTTGHISFLLVEAGYYANIYFNDLTTAKTLLGFPSAGISSDFNDGAPYTAPGIVSISGPRTLVITCPQFRTNLFDTRIGSYGNILAWIPVTASAFQLQIWEDSGVVPRIVGVIQSNIDKITVNLTDENGVILDLQDQPIQLHMMVFSRERIVI